MASRENIAAAIGKEIAALENSTSEKKFAINQTYKTAIESAEKKKRDDLKKLDDDRLELKELKKLYKGATGKDYTSNVSEVTEGKKETASNDAFETVKNYVVKVPATINEAKTNNDKILYVVNLLGKATNKEIKTKIDELKIPFKSNVSDLTGKSVDLTSVREKGVLVYSIKK